MTSLHLPTFAVAAAISLSSLSLSAASAPSAVPTDGLVAYYPFNGNAQDEAGGHDGAVHGAQPAPDRFGNTDAAYHFDGVSQYIEVANDPAFSVPTTGELSISVWMQVDTLNFPTAHNGYVHWMGKGVNGQHEWVFRIYDQNSERPNRTSFYLFNLSGGLGVGSYVQEPIETGQWIHYVAVASVADDRIWWYKNGELKDSDTFLGDPYYISPADGDAPVRIGTRDLASFLKGSIDDIRVYDRKLDADEVQALYHEGEDSMTWAGYPVDENGYVDTGAWMGWLCLAPGDWAWSFSLPGWIYAPDPGPDAAGAWIFALR